MGDKYPNFGTLSKHAVPGRDYRIILERTGTDRVAIIAPHGGSIERRTSEITRAIAADHYPYYLFEGLDPDGSFDELHITSHRFDEPQCLEFVESIDTVIAIHGCNGDEKQVLLGGLHAELKESIAYFLREAGVATDVETHKFQGKHRSNICNRGRLGAGVQIEFSDALRGAAEEASAVDAIRKALSQAVA